MTTDPQELWVQVLLRRMRKLAAMQYMTKFNNLATPEQVILIRRATVSTFDDLVAVGQEDLARQIMAEYS